MLTSYRNYRTACAVTLRVVSSEAVAWVTAPMMVELSPYDRKLLSDAGNVQLRLNGKVVAEATNQNNYNEARRGSN